jgi:hypothetical protein
MYKRPNFADSHLHFVAWLQPLRRIPRKSYTRGRTRQNYAPGLQRASLTAKFDDLWNLEDHVICAAVLPYFSVHFGRQGEAVRVFDQLQTD